MPIKSKPTVAPAVTPKAAEKSTGAVATGGKPEADRLPFGKDAVVAELRSKGCVVTYEKSVTKNLGNYESAKVTVAVTLPIDPTPEEIEQVKKTLEVADAVVTDELEVQIKELVEAK